MLTKDFVDAMKEYNAAQVYYREKYRVRQTWCQCQVPTA